MRGYMAKIKTRKEIDDILGQSITKWLRKNNPSLLDDLLPVSIGNGRDDVVKFCKDKGYLPNQKSSNKIESKLGYIASYYKIKDKDFINLIKEYPTYQKFKIEKRKELLLSEVKNMGYRREESYVRTYINPKNKNYDEIFKNLYLSYPTKQESSKISKVTKIKETSFLDGIFIGSEKDRQFILKNLDLFPEYKKNKPGDRSESGLLKILEFCIKYNRLPSRGPNFCDLNSNNEWFLASRLGDYRKQYIKNKLNLKCKTLINKIFKFKRTVKKIKKCRVINLDTKAIFDSVTDAATSINRSTSTIHGVLCKEKKTAGGYRWAYYEQD
jgi:hypothetical protein